MSRVEKEQFVIQLYKENKSIREIAKLMHMSFRNIGVIINKVKLQAERDRGYNDDDIESKSPESKAFRLFSEGKSPVEVAMALDEPGDRVRAMYREYWELSGRYKLAQIYDEARYDLKWFVEITQIINDLGMNEQDIHKVLELAKYDELLAILYKVCTECQITASTYSSEPVWF